MSCLIIKELGIKRNFRGSRGGKDRQNTGPEQWYP